MKTNFHLHQPFSTHWHWPEFTWDDTRDMRWLFALRINRNLIIRFSLFFLPIYLFILGRSENFVELIHFSPLQKGMLLVGGFFIWFRFLIVIFSMPINRIIARIGQRWAFFSSHIFYVIFLLGLVFSQHNWTALIWAAIAFAMSTVLYWNSYHTLISKLTHKKNMGEDLGLLNFLIQLGSALVPAVGGGITIVYGFKGLFLTSIIWTISGMFFSLQLKHHRETVIPSWSEFWQWMSESRFIRLSLSFSGRVFNDLALRVWPLYVFIVLKAIDKVGYLYTTSLLIALFLSLVVGYYIDHHRSRRPFILSGGFLSLVWVFRSLAVNAWGIALSDVADKLVSNFHWLFYDSVMFKRGMGKQAFAYFAYREIIVSTAEIVFWLLFISVFLVSEYWLLIFGLGSLGVLLSLMMKDE